MNQLTLLHILSCKVPLHVPCVGGVGLLLLKNGTVVGSVYPPLSAVSDDKTLTVDSTS